MKKEGFEFGGASLLVWVLSMLGGAILVTVGELLHLVLHGQFGFEHVPGFVNLWFAVSALSPLIVWFLAAIVLSNYPPLGVGLLIVAGLLLSFVSLAVSSLIIIFCYRASAFESAGLAVNICLYAGVAGMVIPTPGLVIVRLFHAMTPS